MYRSNEEWHAEIAKDGTESVGHLLEVAGGGVLRRHGEGDKGCGVSICVACDGVS